MKQKFHMERYYDELGSVEEKLSRIKSEKSTKQIRRDENRGGVAEHGWVPAGRSPLVPTRQYPNDKMRSAKENDVGGRPNSKPRIRLDSRYDRDPSFLDTHQTVIRRSAADIHAVGNSKLDDSFEQQRPEKDIPQKKTVFEEPTNHTEERIRKQSIAGSTVKQQQPLRPTEQQQIFIRQTSNLYHMNYLASQDPINQLVQQLRKRDSVYRTVQERFQNESQLGYNRQLQNLFRREATLTRIVSEFKKLSNIQLQDLDELLYFLKNQ